MSCQPQPQAQPSTLPPLTQLKVDFLAGVSGALVSTSLLQPIDIARTRYSVQGLSPLSSKYTGFFQTFSSILKEEGLKGLYTGYCISVFTGCCWHGIFFGSYQLFKNTCYSYNQQCLVSQLVSIAGASVIADTLTCPLWIARLRLQTDRMRGSAKYVSCRQTLMTVYREEGIRHGWYKGLSFSLLGVVHLMVYFPLYEEMLSWGWYSLSVNVMLSSVCAKSVAIVMTFPHVVVRNRLVFEDGGRQTSCLMYVINETYRRQGLRGFYAGITFELFRIIPNNTIIFYLYEVNRLALNSYYSNQ